MEKFENLKLIGEGTFGKVFVGNEKNGSQKYAIKKIQIEKGGLSTITIRELSALKKYKYKNIVRLFDTYIEDMNFYMILEYLPFDLSALFLSKYIFQNSQIKNLMFQLLQGLSFIHSKGLIHRDIKSSNILLTQKGELKIADFGLSKTESKNMTNQVCTLWYRAPELLLGENKYDNRIDTWSVGCILIEFKTFTPFFSETNEISQIKKILSVLGAPKQNYKYNSLFKIRNYTKEISWKETIHNVFDKYFNIEFLELLEKMLNLDYQERISCTDALQMPFLQNSKNETISIYLNDIHDTIIRHKLKEQHQKKIKK